MLENIFIVLCKEYGQTNRTFWQEIETAYKEKHRHYHTLAHLQNMYEQLTLVKPQIMDWNAILFALYYHDIIYNPLKQNNEESSATLAVKRLNALNVDKKTINKTEHLILATKKHAFTFDMDTQYFLDADLSVLGQD